MSWATVIDTAPSSRAFYRWRAFAAQPRRADWSHHCWHTVRTLLLPAAEKLLIATRVSTRANSVKNDDPGVLEEVATPGLI